MWLGVRLLSLAGGVGVAGTEEPSTRRAGGQGYRIWKYRGFHLGFLVMSSRIFGFNPLDIR